MRIDPQEQFTFAARPIPSRVPITQHELAQNTEAQKLSSIATCRFLNATMVDHASLQTILDEQRRPFGGGRVAEGVEPSDVGFDVASETIGIFTGPTLRRNETPPPVRKRNFLDLEDDHEYQIHQALTYRGLPVPRIRRSIANGKLEIEHLGPNLAQTFLEGWVAREEALLEEQSLEQTFEHKIGALVARFDATLESILTEQGKAILERKMYNRLAHSTNSTPQMARDHYTSLRLANSIPNCSAADLPLVEDLAQKVEECTTRFSCWTANINPGNIYTENRGDVGDPDYHFWISDFNIVRPASMQESLAYIIDAFLPIRAPDCVVLDFYSVHAQKATMVEDYLKEYERQSGKQIDRAEFHKYLPYARIAVDLRCASYALDELAKSKDYTTYLLKLEEVRYHISLSLALLDTTHDGNDYTPLRDLISTKYVTALHHIVDQETVMNAANWENIVQVPPKGYSPDRSAAQE